MGDPETVTTVTYYDANGYPVGTVGSYGEDWWGSAASDVRGFPDEAAADAWVSEQVGADARREPPTE